MATSMVKGNPVKLMLSFAFPLLIGNLLQQTYNIIDAAIVGQALGPEHSPASVQAAVYSFWFLDSVWDGCTGFGVPVAKYFGAEKMDTNEKLCINVRY